MIEKLFYLFIIFLLLFGPALGISFAQDRQEKIYTGFIEIGEGFQKTMINIENIESIQQEGLSIVFNMINDTRINFQCDNKKSCDAFVNAFKKEISKYRTQKMKCKETCKKAM